MLISIHSRVPRCFQLVLQSDPLTVVHAMLVQSYRVNTVSLFCAYNLSVHVLHSLHHTLVSVALQIMMLSSALSFGLGGAAFADALSPCGDDVSRLE